MNNINFDQIEQLSLNFKSSKKLLLAIGDETRFHIINEMMKMGNCSGVRVGEITNSTNLSRPAVSHHLKILKEAGIIKCRRDGTKNYYYFALNINEFQKLIDTLQMMIDISSQLPSKDN